MPKLMFVADKQALKHLGVSYMFTLVSKKIFFGGGGVPAQLASFSVS